MRFPCRTSLCALAAAAGLGACARPPAPEGPPPRTLAQADPIITGLQPMPHGVRVVARIDQPDVAGGVIRQSAQAMRQVARALQNGAPDLPPGARTLAFALYGVDVDKFGKRSFGRLFESDFDVADLRQLDLKARGPAAVLDTAIDLHLDKGGIDPVNAWCMRYPHAGANFCSMAGD